MSGVMDDDHTTGERAAAPEAPAGFPPDARAGETPATVGETLRRERDLREVTLQEISEETKISVRHLEALERNDFERLPGGIYTKNFLRAYGRYLGLDEDKIINDYLFQTGPRREAALAEQARDQRKGLSGVTVVLLVAIPVVLLTLAVALAFTQGWLPIGPWAPPPTPAPAPEPADTAAAPAADPAGGPLLLALEAAADTWVELRADDGEAVDRLLPKGERLEVSFSEKVEMNLGDAGAVRWSLNGRPGRPLGSRGEMRHNIVIDRANFARLLEEKSPEPGP
jgi:cytoskeletal protein RodZ